jgi:hypothetical protein
VVALAFLVVPHHDRKRRSDRAPIQETGLHTAEGREFDSPRAHHFLRLFEEIAGSAELSDNDYKLPTFAEKLPTRSKS